MHMCAYLALNYVTSSFFYFEKTLVVATGELRKEVAAFQLVLQACPVPLLMLPSLYAQRMMPV